MSTALITAKANRQVELRWDPEAIPPFPAVALKALKLMSGTDTSLLDLCNLIRCDPAFSIAILKVANSPLVSFSKNVTSVLQASMVLGFLKLRRVVITVGLKSYFENSFSLLIRSCWRHSVACAIIAERCAKWSSLDSDFAYTAGILHDVGRVALATFMPDAYARVLKHGADRPEDLLLVEREFCGIDHCEAGRSLVGAWNLPGGFLEITACHHEREVRPPGTASLIPPSCELADALGFSVIHCRSPRSYSDILADFPERARNRFPTEAEELALDITNEIKVIESL
jgi:putative nucleotidyltransferase with HDIG domain